MLFCGRSLKLSVTGRVLGFRGQERIRKKQQTGWTTHAGPGGWSRVTAARLRQREASSAGPFPPWPEARPAIQKDSFSTSFFLIINLYFKRMITGRDCFSFCYF